MLTIFLPCTFQYFSILFTPGRAIFPKKRRTSSVEQWAADHHHLFSCLHPRFHVPQYQHDGRNASRQVTNTAGACFCFGNFDWQFTLRPLFCTWLFYFGCFTLVVLLCCAVLCLVVDWHGTLHPPSTPSSIMQSTDDVALGLATRFMNVNKLEAHKNFGNSADNMTAVVCTIYPSTAKWKEEDEDRERRGWVGKCRVAFRKSNTPCYILFMYPRYTSCTWYCCTPVACILVQRSLATTGRHVHPGTS